MTTDFAGSSDTAFSLALQSDGKIVAAGRTFINGGFHSGLARYNSDGTLDASFGTGGKVTTNFEGESDGVSSVAVQPDAKILAAGSANINEVNRFALSRYLTPSSTPTPPPTPTPTPRTNFALATNGGVASASSQYNGFYPVGSIQQW